jgi:lysozyme family protein
MKVDMMIDKVIGIEGGYANHPADKGGPTRWGVTEAVARLHGFPGNMRDFPRDEAVVIYKRLYWLKPGFDRIDAVSPVIAAELFDTGVNMGPATAIGFLVRALNALNRNGTDFADLPLATHITDGVAACLKAFLSKRGKSGEAVLLRAMEALQGERYVRLSETRPANEAFVYGWLANRIGIAA